MIKLSAYLVAALLLSGCDGFKEPSTVDPTPVLGCYIAPDAPALSIQKAGVQIAHGSEVLPFRYQQAKVGMVLATPLVASVDKGAFRLQKGDEHFYRVLWTDTKPTIIVVFGPEGITRNYERGSKTAC
jgi:hypothetical protein